jgi:hypothetical protein
MEHGIAIDTFYIENVTRKITGRLYAPRSRPS